jgi:CRISPR system Cascade subunit CasD
MKTILLRFEAPLISFGAPIVDRFGVIQPYPALSMLTGFIANALGYRHQDFAKLEDLQNRLVYAVRQDKPGQRLRDYQTVNLGASYMHDDLAWTTAGFLEDRKGGTASSSTHERIRDYWADASYTVAISLQPNDRAPTLDQIEQALQRPERPLFIGRKNCLPACPVFLETLTAASVLDALKKFPLPVYSAGGGQKCRCYAWWPADIEVNEPEKFPASDKRDWRNQIHLGQRWITRGTIDVVTRGAP